MVKTIPKKQNKYRQTEPRTNGTSKAVETKSYREAYTYTLIRKEKGKKKYLYIKQKKEEKSNQISKKIYQ